LGIDTDDKDNPIMLNQSHHSNHLLQRHQMDKRNALKQPLSISTKLKPPSDGGANATFYNLVGSLRNIADSTIPELSYATPILSRFLHIATVMNT
jgi:hypothetical protein